MGGDPIAMLLFRLFGDLGLFQNESLNVPNLS
jgi:hypothetical protein